MSAVLPDHGSWLADRDRRERERETKDAHSLDRSSSQQPSWLSAAAAALAMLLLWSSSPRLLASHSNAILPPAPRNSETTNVLIGVPASHAKNTYAVIG